MKIKKNQKKSKKYILILVLISGALLIGWIIYRNMSLNTSPANNPVQTTTNKSTANTPSPDNTGADDSDTNSTDSNATDTDTDSSSSNAGDSSDYITTPITPPRTDDSFPIENAHYSIEQINDTTFSITLFPIANNPSNSNYLQQVRDYKAEVLQYLQKRYGSTEALTITWNPEAANEV